MKYPFRLYFLLGIFNLLIPISGISWWIYITQTNSGDQIAKVNQFMSPFPAFIEGTGTVTGIMIIFCSVAFWMFFKGLESKGYQRVLSLIMLSFTGLIGFWLLFTLM